MMPSPSSNQGRAPRQFVALLMQDAERIEILDNSQGIAAGQPIPATRRLVVIESGTPVELSASERVAALPEWVHPILGAFR